MTLQEIKLNIANARKQSNITQEEMAKLLGISQPAYSYYEAGDKPIPLNKIESISKILSIPMDLLVDDLCNDKINDNLLTGINNNLERIAIALENIYILLNTNNKI